MPLFSPARLDAASLWKTSAPTQKGMVCSTRSRRRVDNRMGKKNPFVTAALASQLQLLGMECSDLTILRIEQGSRFVPDYEVAILAKYFNISTDTLLK